MKRFTFFVKPVPVNQRYSIIRGRNRLSKEYRDTKESLARELRSLWHEQPLQRPVSMRIFWYFGDKRRRDIDAYLKMVLDAMKGIVYDDDSRVDELHIFKRVDIANPRTEVEIE